MGPTLEPIYYLQRGIDMMKQKPKMVKHVYDFSLHVDAKMY